MTIDILKLLIGLFFSIFSSTLYARACACLCIQQDLRYKSNFVIVRFGYRLHISENIGLGKCKTPRLTRKEIRLLRTCSPDAMRHTENKQTKRPSIINQKKDNRKIEMY